MLTVRRAIKLDWLTMYMRSLAYCNGKTNPSPCNSQMMHPEPISCKQAWCTVSEWLLFHSMIRYSHDESKKLCTVAPASFLAFLAWRGWSEYSSASVELYLPRLPEVSYKCQASKGLVGFKYKINIVLWGAVNESSDNKGACVLATTSCTKL